MIINKLLFNVHGFKSKICIISVLEQNDSQPTINVCSELEVKFLTKQKCVKFLEWSD